MELLRLCFGSLLLCGAVACGGDPAVGNWESEYDTGGEKDTFSLSEVGGGLTGGGTWNSAVPGVSCPVDVEVDLGVLGRYVGTITGSGPCDGTSLPFDCELKDGNDRFLCSGGESFKRLN